MSLLDTAAAVTGFPAVRLGADGTLLHLASLSPMRVLSSAVVGAGLTATRHLVIVRVPRDYGGSDPARDLREVLAARGIAEPAVGFLTAAAVDTPRVVVEASGSVRVLAVVTVGLGNLSAAGLSPPAPRHPGTINALIVVDGTMVPGALVNAVITATEAKAAALAARCLRTMEGWPATGTSTDAIAVACTGRGPELPYAGPVTTVGWLIGRAIRRALEEPARP